MSTETILEQALQAIEQGDKERARDLLTRVLKAQPQNLDAWLWMSSVVETPKEQIYCLQQASRLDPQNPIARRGLILLGAMPTGAPLPPAPLVRRKWEVTLGDVDDDNQQSGLNLSRRQIFTLVGSGLVVLLLLSWGIFGATSRAWSPFSPRLTITPIPWTSTPSPFITATPTTRPSATPTFAGPTPLANLLLATYTPTPLYVNTPHARSEAYRVAMTSFNRGDLQTAATYLLQAISNEPDAPDLHYHLGEVYRLLGDYPAALAAFNQAIDRDGAFGPAYLGRARVRLAQNPNENILGDLDLAIETDPAYSEAYLERAAFLLGLDEFDGAMVDLDAAEALNPHAPLLYLYRARALLALGEPAEALLAAQTAYRLDVTNPAVYGVLAEAFIANDMIDEAVEPLEVYLAFVDDDPHAWLLLARVYLLIGATPELIEQALDNALALDNRLAEGHVLRGELALAAGEGQAAFNAFQRARDLQGNSFEIGLGMGRGLLLANRFNDAVRQLNSIEPLARLDEQRAALFYWRAQVYEAAGNWRSAIADWQALLTLPDDAVPEEWLLTAEERLTELIEPTPSPSATASSTPTRTPSPTASGTSTRTPTPSQTPTPSRTPTPTP